MSYTATVIFVDLVFGRCEHDTIERERGGMDVHPGRLKKQRRERGGGRRK